MSSRLEATGLHNLLADVAKYCFSGEPCLPPPKARTILDKLVHPDHALVNIMRRGKSITFLHHWPSWLNKGHKRHLSIFKDMFYPSEGHNL
jgi:hypothetical protein